MYKKILLSLERTDELEEILTYLEPLAKGSEVIVLKILPQSYLYTGWEGDMPVELVDKQMEELEAMTYQELRKVEWELKGKGIKVQTVVRFGNAAEQIVNFAKGNNIDFIALESNGHTGFISRFFHSGIASKVIKNVDIPVLVVKVRPKSE